MLHNSIFALHPPFRVKTPNSREAILTTPATLGSIIAEPICHCNRFAEQDTQPSSFVPVHVI